MVLSMTAWTPHVTVATVVEKDGRFLFVEEHSEGFVHTVFNQPAGHVESVKPLSKQRFVKP
jgi:ADP-ribose pyrophosphatase YjhB (NUDIX family)